MPSALDTKTLLASLLALTLLRAASTARADDSSLEATVRARANAAETALRAGVELASPSHEAAVDLRALLEGVQRAGGATQVRLDGALFAGLASAGLVVAAQPGTEETAPRPTAGLSPRLLRGGGLVCDVRVAF